MFVKINFIIIIIATGAVAAAVAAVPLYSYSITNSANKVARSSEQCVVVFFILVRCVPVPVRLANARPSVCVCCIVHIIYHKRIEVH